MEVFAMRDLREHTGELVRNAEGGQLSVVSKYGSGSGEIAVLSYAYQHSLVALVDERRARAIAKQLGVSVVGIGAVLRALKKSGSIASIRPTLEAWSTRGYFLSATLQRRLLAEAGELA